MALAWRHVAVQPTAKLCGVRAPSHRQQGGALADPGGVEETDRAVGAEPDHCIDVVVLAGATRPSHVFEGLADGRTREPFETLVAG